MTDRTRTTLFSSIFALLFAASLALAGCAGTLTAPQPQPQQTAPTPTVVTDTDVEAPHNHSENNNGGGGTSGAADHNIVVG